jgi:alkylation response protein AidB-like acyl-CoA dehydrogenase
VDFTLSEEQELVRQTARQLLTKECPPTLVRDHADDPAVVTPLFDRHLREWVALGDGPLVDLCLFCEEAGAVLLPGPYAATTSLFVPLLRALDHELADAAAAGEITGTVALAGASGVWTVNDDPVRRFVLELEAVDWVAVVGEGPSVVLLRADSVARRPLGTLDTTRRVFDLDGPFEGERLALDADAVERVVQRATVAAAAELVGTSRWLTDTTVAYAKEREQFDRPIGSFQGLQFAMVDLALDHERAAAAVGYAAMALDADDADRRRAVHVAKAAAGTAARRAARGGLQIHAGIGYTWEHDLHLYLRRAYATDDLFGDAAWHHDRLAHLLLD